MPPQEPQSNSLPAGYHLDAVTSAPNAGGLPAGYKLDRGTPTAATPANAPSVAPQSSIDQALGLDTGVLLRGVSHDTGHLFGQGWDEAKGLATGAAQAANAPPTTSIEKALNVMGYASGTNPLGLKRLLVDPAIQKGKSTVQALRSGEWMKAGLGAAATLNPMAPDVTKLYDQSASGDTVGAAGRGFTDIMAMQGLDLMKDAVNLINRAPSIDQGKTGYVTQARNAVNKLDNAISTQGVGARANQVIAADDLHNARTQSPGYVNGAAVVNKMDAVTKNVGLGLDEMPQINAQMSMKQAKTMMTQLGRQASRLERTGKSPEAASVWAGYDALRDETMTRARALDTLQPGAGHAQAWGDYAKEFKEHMKVIHSGPIGAMMEGEPVAALDKLIKGEGVLKGRDVSGPTGTEHITGADDWFKKYDVDFKPITDAIKQGKVLNDLSDYTSNALMGKIKMIARHPVVGIPMIMAESKMFSGMHMGGLGTFVLPLIIAAKVGKILDNIQIHKVLTDIGKHIPAEDMSLSAKPLGPHTPTDAPWGPMGPEPTAGGPPDSGTGGGAGGVPTAPTPVPESGVPAASIPPSDFSATEELAQKLKGARKAKGAK
jgi:hypothetical protein